MQYEIYRIEGRGKIKLCSQNFEQPELFKLIANNPNYMIYENDKDVTEQYKGE